MRILMLGSGSIRSNFMHRLLVFAKALQRRGHNVTIIAPKADKYNGFVAETITDIEGVRIAQPFQFTTKRVEVNLLPYLFDAARLVLRQKPDLVYIYKPTPVSVVGLVSTLFRRTPTVLDMDDLGSEVMKIEGHPAHQRKLVEWSERLAARYAHRFVMASTYLRDFQRTRYPNKPVLVVPNGAEASWLAAKPIHSPSKKRIVFFGSFNRKNILEPLFDALPVIFKAHPTAQVLLIGDGQYMPYFKAKAKELGVPGTVTFTGWLPIEQARPLLCIGDIGYNYMPNEPTVRAASNMKVAQYMSRGVVPLVSDVGDLAWMVDGGKAGYVVVPDNAKALTTALLKALADPERLKKAERAIRYAEDTLAIDKQAEAFDHWLKADTSHDDEVAQ